LVAQRASVAAAGHAWAHRPQQTAPSKRQALAVGRGQASAAEAAWAASASLHVKPAIDAHNFFGRDHPVEHLVDRVAIDARHLHNLLDALRTGIGSVGQRVKDPLPG